MTTLVIYDSAYGNTGKIAQAIAEATGSVGAESIAGVDAGHLPPTNLLIVGSPTQGGRPTAAMTAWLERIPAGSLAGLRVAAFDTRLPVGDQNFALRMLMGLIGYAAPRILKALEARGGRVAATAEGFIVTGKEGPLRDGEIERAAQWAAALAQLHSLAA
jgi:flavodoxin